MNIDNALILAAGIGSRLQPLTNKIPKPLVQVGHQKAIDYAIDQLNHTSIQNIHINTHHKAEMIEQHISNISKSSNKNFILSHEPELLGTGGTIKKLKKEHLLVINADAIVDGFVINDLIESYEPKTMDMLCYAVAGKDFSIDINSGKITKNGNYTLAGIYIVNYSIFSDIKEETFGMQELLYKKNVYAKILRNKWFDIGTHASLNDANQYWQIP